MTAINFWNDEDLDGVAGFAASAWDNETGDQLAYRVFASTEQASRFLADVYQHFSISERRVSAEILEHAGENVCKHGAQLLFQGFDNHCWDCDRERSERLDNASEDTLSLE